MPEPIEVQPPWYTKHLKTDTQTESREIVNLDFSVYPSGIAVVELRLPINHVLADSVLQSHQDTLDTKIVHSELGLGPDDFTSGAYFKKRGLFGVIALERQLSDAEAFFLIATKEASPKWPIQNYIQRIHACAALGMSTTVETEAVPLEDTIIDFSPDKLLGSLNTSAKIQEVLHEFEGFTAIIKTIEELKAKQAGMRSLMPQVVAMELSGGRLLLQIQKSNVVLKSGVLTPIPTTGFDDYGYRIKATGKTVSSLSNPSDYEFRLMLKVPDQYDKQGYPVCVQNVNPLEVKPKELKNIVLVFAPACSTTKQ